MKNLIVVKLLSFLLIASFIIGLSGCKKDDEIVENPKTLVIGVIVPLDQEKGILRSNAFRLAIDEINAAGGVGDGYQIILDVRSDEGANRKEIAAAAAKDIISQNDNVIGFVSAFSSSSSGILEDVCIPDHYPLVTGSATSNTLTNISAYFHRLCPPDEFEANVLSDRTNFYGINSVAIAIEDGDTYSEDLASAFESQYGAGVTTKINFITNDIDYLNKINQLIAGNPEGIFVSMLNPASYIKFFDNLSLVNTTFILPDAVYSSDFFQADIDQILGDINGHTKNFGAFPSADTSTGAYIYFKDAFWQKYNKEISSYNPQFYDVGYIYAMAIEKAFQEIGLNDLSAFREKVNDFIRPVSHGNGSDPIVTPDQGWNTVKAACMAGGVDYSGASGDCDINNEGNAFTAYSIFKVIKVGNDYAFKIIEVIP